MTTPPTAPTRSAADGSRVTVLVRRVAPALAGLVLLAKVVTTVAAPLTNSDTYFHLRLGSEFRDGWPPWAPGHLDRFATADWLPTQWLSQVAMSATESWLGLPGVAFLYGFLVVVLLAAWWRTAREHADPLVTCLVVVLAFVASAPYLSMRPQLVSFVLATVVVRSWGRARTTARAPWVLVPLGWLWAMCHGMWVLGVAISAAAAVALVLERRLRPSALLVPAGMLLAAFVTPVGPGLPAAAVLVNSRRDLFSEWAPPELLTTYGVAVLALLAACVVVGLRSGPASWLDVAMVVVGLAFAVYSQRTVPVAACVLLPLAARSLQSVVGERTAPTRREQASVGTGLVAALLVIGALVPRTSDEPPAPVVAFDEPLTAMAADTPVLTDWPEGGVLLELHPELAVPAHGYLDLYTDAELDRIAGVLALVPGWDRDLRELGITTALLPEEMALTYALREHGWTSAHEAEGLVLLRAPTGSP